MKYTLLLIVLAIVGCKGRPATTEQMQEETTAEVPTFDKHVEVNSIYYWKTIFELNDSELAFLQQYDIKRIYIRYFDVALDNNWLEDELSAIPTATAIFKQTPPETLEVVPTVFITLEALLNMSNNEADYANNIVTRVLAMSKRHNIQNVTEVQFDGDWSKSTEQTYTKLCSVAKNLLHKKGIALSSTIRLFQLNSSVPPPVDRGVLMLYNAGSLRNAKSKNSILNYTDMEPYLKSASSALHLDFAYPAFAWGVWFRNGVFKAIIRKTDFSDKMLYQLQRDGTYKVIKGHHLESHELLKGDIIRLENSDYDEIMRVKRLVNNRLGQKTHSVALYHLDSANLTKYTSDEIKNIYRRN